MDTLGDADRLDDDDLPARDSLMTPHARVLTGAALVLTGLFSTGLFQYLAVLLRVGSNPWHQYALYAGPTGVFALAGVLVAWPVRRAESLGPTTRGAAVATGVVGAVLALVVAVGMVVAYTRAPDDF